MTTPRTANLIIAGLGKAGSTSLFWYLSQHPEICASSAKETRFFMALAQEGGELPPIQDYAAYFTHCGDARYYLEASPQYFHFGERIIPAMKRTLDDPKVIITVRDPVTRIWSAYRFMKVKQTLPESMTFEAYVEACREVKDTGQPLSKQNRHYWPVTGSAYVTYLRPWLDAFGDDLRVVFFEDLTADPLGMAGDLCRWLGIDAEVARAFDYTVENRTVAVQSRGLQRVATRLNSERLLGSRRRLKAPLRKLYYAVNRRRQEERMSPQTRLELTEMFRQANEELGRELRARGYRALPAWIEGHRAAAETAGGA